jgi:Tol biopolymer transport system component/serine/threonine protein kinase
VTVEKWREVLSCYQAALETPAERRREFLESTETDPEVIEKVLRMLEALDQEKSELTAGSPVTKGPLRTGTTVGRYEVGAPLGEGGMGEVYTGWDPALDRAVALKFLRDERTRSPAAAVRFVSEAKAASALNHPNIVTVHEVLHDHDSLVMVMELVEGQSVRELCRAPAPLETLVNVGRQTALALAAAHAHGIIHRDVKPENIMVRTDGYVKLLDFGLARRIALDESTEGLPVGTLRYMSPEQVSGEKLSSATDIFSLGLVLSELAAGRHPYVHYATLDSAAAIVSEPIRDAGLSNPSLPARLVSLIDGMLSREPGRRPAAAEVAAVLGSIGESSATGVPGAAAQETGVLRKPRVWLASVAGLLGLAVLVVSFWPGNPRPSIPELRARPLTSQPGWEESPSFSPDGESVAFTWAGKRNQSPQIFVKRLDADAPVQLTGSESGAIGPLAWSPDGNRIAFKRQYGEPGAIYAIPKQGGKEIKLVDLLVANLSSSLDWSPDGTQIVFSDALPETDRLAIYSFNVQTGAKRKLTSPPAEDWGDWDPRFSPDGTTLAFKRVRGYSLDAVYLMPSAGGPLRRVTKDPASISGHDWMPKGDGLIVSTQLGGSIQELWRFPLTPGTEPVRITRGGLDAITPVSSSNGSRIAWVNRLHDTNIYRAPLTGGGAPTQFITSTLRDEGACYSPDGRIAFASDRSGSWNIWIARSDGSNQVRVTSFSGPHTGFPRWSPDGRRVAFGISREWDDESKGLSRGGIFVLECQYGSVRCGEPKKLTGGSGAKTSAEGHPSWSWDGAYVYFTSNRTGRNELWRQALAGGAAIQVTRNGGYSSSESRDGKWLYFSKTQSDDIWRMPGSRAEATTASADERLLLGPPVDLLPGDWTLTPDAILFVGLAGDKRLRAIRGYRLVSGETRTILTIPEMPQSGSALSVSPDSRWLLYSQLDRSGSNIMVAEASR